MHKDSATNEMRLGQCRIKRLVIQGAHYITPHIQD